LALTHQLTNSPTHQVPAVIVFDGVCNLCNGLVDFVIARDPDARFRFASLQSDAARRLLHGAQLEPPLRDSVVLIEHGHVFRRSEAALRIARRLGAPWSFAYPLVAVPRPVRDWIYEVVARNRYRWFGKRPTCRVPTADLRRRFLE
jgi:predicted DCC family thiol-disulfide oxidoreductase YuxK